jgi:hypothetical protein
LMAATGRPGMVGGGTCITDLYNYYNITRNESRKSLGMGLRPNCTSAAMKDRRVIAVRALFLRGLEEQSRNVINYYDFLLVAKKLNFRFE